MKVFAIGDLHLSFGEPTAAGAWRQATTYKPMEVFGAAWNRYYERIYESWQHLVGPEDAVLMPGDTSWAMTLAAAAWDFDFLAQLPGHIYLGRGNHDYWWQGIGKLRQALPANVTPLHHSCACVGGRAVCSTRGWQLPGQGDGAEADAKILQRELLRLEMALAEGQATGLPLVAMLHYMPCQRQGQDSVFLELLRRYEVELCVYGHLHGGDCRHAVQGPCCGVELVNVSCDCLGFEPRLLWTT